MVDKYAYTNQRIFIVDLNTMVHRYFNAMAKVSLTAVVMLDGEPRTINTSIVSSVLKAITRLSNDGVNPVIVVLDRPIKTRKSFFEYYTGTGEIGSHRQGYKGTRDAFNYKIGNDLDLIATKLLSAGCNVLFKDDYEADDIIVEAVRFSKEKFPDLPIHLIANDLDLTPLIDEQVTMYRRTKKLEYAEEGYPVLTNMYQTTVNNYRDEMEATSVLRGLLVPYNSVLLAKLLRGDKSDNIRHIDKLTPTIYNRIVTDMESKGILEQGLFKYHHWGTEFINTVTGEKFSSFSDVPDAMLKAKQVRIELLEPAEISMMQNVLSEYLSDDDVREAMLRYTGMNLNGAIRSVPNTPYKRRPFVLPDDYDVKPFPKMELARQVSDLSINLVNV